jgi:sugar-specific transcriptional regulator TrmB
LGELELTDNNDYFHTLVQLGLTNSQAKVYLSLTKLGTGKAKAIWQLSGVARQDLYRILVELQREGLVEKVIATPNEFRAIPLAEGVSILFERKKKGVANLQAETKKIMDAQRKIQNGLVSEEHCCIMIPEKEALAFRINESFDRAKNSIDVSSSWKRLSVSLSKYRYADALERGVRVRVIVNAEEQGFIERIDPLILSKPNFDARWLPQSPSSVFACLDQREAYISTNAEAGLENACMLWSNYPTLVALVHNSFEAQWIKAKRKTKRLLKTYAAKNKPRSLQTGKIKKRMPLSALS